jgi:VanZ family protein
VSSAWLGRWAPAILWAALIFYLSSQSHLPEPPPGITDKHAHLAVYAVLAATLVWALTDRAPWRTSWTIVVAVVILCTLYGASDEFHQSFVPGREVSGLDLTADAAGAAIAAVTLRAWAIIRPRR